MNKTNKDLVNRLTERNLIESKEVKQAFLKVDRKDFLPKDKEKWSYSDTPIPIGKGQTISAPHMVAIMTEKLEVKNRSKILEIGTGSGYQAAILAEIAEKGEIHTTEKVKSLYKTTQENLKRYRNIKIYKKDGSQGIPEVAPFDRIISTCGAPEIPKPWKKQLKETGVILAPIGGKYKQRLKRYRKEEGEIKEEDLNLPCAFVPMKGKHGF